MLIKLFQQQMQRRAFIAIFAWLALGANTGALYCQQLQSYFNAFVPVNIPSGILFNKGYINPKQFEPFLLETDPRVNITNAAAWKQHYAQMRECIKDNTINWPSLSDFYATPAETSPQVTIAGFFAEGQYVHPSQMEPFFYQGQFSTNTPVDTIVVSMMSNLRSIVNSNEVLYTFDTLQLFTNLPHSEILGMNIDFGDGNSSQDFNFENFQLQVQYNSIGVKQLRFELATTKGRFVTYSNIQVLPDYSFSGTQFREVTAILPGGKKQEGSYSLNLSCDGVLDKPFIVVEGFDPLDQIDPIESQQKYLQAGLLSYLLEYGYDVIGLQFKENNDYLQNNAWVVKALIEQINQEKEGHFENIIVGESNGGINTRIALAQMEAEHIDHEVGLFISFDSPQAGANMPLGVQEFGYDSQNLDFTTTAALIVGGGLLGGINLGLENTAFLGGALGLYIDLFGGGQKLANDMLGGELIKTIESNESSAARQQLIRHRDENYKTMILNPEHEFFELYLKQLGYPEECRKVALINGSNTAKKQDSDFGDKIMDIIHEDFWGLDFIFSADAYAKISPINTPYDAQGSKVSAIESSFLIFDLISESGVFSFETSKPYDLAPGGITLDDRIMKQYSFSHTTSTIDLDASIRNGSFGPDITDDGLFYFNQNAADPKRHREYIVRQGLTPFDDIYADSLNTEHINFGPIHKLVDSIRLREFMFDQYVLQNRTIKNGWKRNFRAEEEMLIGRNVSNAVYSGKLIDTLDVHLLPGSHVEASAAKYIRLSSGTKIDHAAHFHAVVDTSHLSCHSVFSGGPAVYKRIVPVPVAEKQYDEAIHQTSFKVVNRDAAANSSDYSWVLAGNGVEVYHNGYDFSVTDLPTGTYSLECSLFGTDRKTLYYFSIKEDGSSKPSVQREAPVAFYAQLWDNKVSLRWESNLPEQKFFVERLDQQQWKGIATQTTSRQEENPYLSYVIDSFPQAGFNFYRLRWKRPDGVEDVSETRSVWYPVVDGFSLSPNPASDHITFQVGEIPDNSNSALTITDALGRTVWHATALLNSKKYSIPLNNLPNGLYSASYRMEGQPPITKRFIVEH